MKNDPIYLSKDKSLEAPLGVLLVDGNFEDSVACFGFFVKFQAYKVSTVGRTALCPTLDQVTNKLYHSISVIYAYIYPFCNAFDLCQLVSDRGQSDLQLFIEKRNP